MGRLIDADKLKLDLSKELIRIGIKIGATKLDMARMALEVVDESPTVDAVSKEQYDKLKHEFEAAMNDLQRREGLKDGTYGG